MNRQHILIGLSAVICFQLLVLTFEYVGAVYPLWTGEEVKLKTIPVDPRSLFRGNYALLNYEITEISSTDINQFKRPRNGEVVYIRLKQDEEGISDYDGVTLDEPVDGIFIRGRIENHYYYESDTTYTVNYGIEAFFAPKQRALDLESDLRHGGVATVMIASNGKATLKDVLPK